MSKKLYSTLGTQEQRGIREGVEVSADRSVVLGVATAASPMGASSKVSLIQNHQPRRVEASYPVPVNGAPQSAKSGEVRDGC